jgi:hypothetical protein
VTEENIIGDKIHLGYQNGQADRQSDLKDLPAADVDL